MKLSAISTLALMFFFRWGAVIAEVESTREASIIDSAGSAKKDKFHEVVEPAESSGLRGKTHGSLAEVDGIMERSLAECPTNVGPVPWENYHWSKCSIVDVAVDRVLSTKTWQNHFTTAVDNWNKANSIQVTKTNLAYSNSSATSCSPSTGRIKVCNNNYGKTGWLGIAGVWISGAHITRAYTKVNDYYFSQPYYNTTKWRGAVMCQELGHNFGLGHWDVDFNTNCDSCMDYSTDPKPYPNQKDLDFLDNVIYENHCSERRLQGQSGEKKKLPDPPGKAFGKKIDDDSHSSTYEIVYPNGTWITEVLWVDENHVD